MQKLAIKERAREENLKERKRVGSRKPPPNLGKAKQ
jgi:hypothetical protein